MPLEDIEFCEVYYPTIAEFQDFYAYVEKLSKINKTGIVKVKIISYCKKLKKIIPPKNWQPRKDHYKDIDFKIPGPIEQIVNGSNGIYEMIYLQRESRSLSRYEKLVSSFDANYDSNKHIEMEKKFWKTIKFSTPLYGADAPGSLFDKGCLWNLTEIPSLLKEGLTKDLKGVTSPYLYIGCWKAMFAWHKEDLDLSSINYLHFGKPKCWYGIPPSEDKKLDELAAKYFPTAKKECREFMRHKTFLINPEIIKQNGINIYRCIQEPGEFVITFGGCYHAGFNMGLNCAEAVNFATKNWIGIGINAKFCKCQKGSVQIGMEDFCKNLADKRLIKKKELDGYIKAIKEHQILNECFYHFKKNENGVEENKNGFTFKNIKASKVKKKVKGNVRRRIKSIKVVKSKKNKTAKNARKDSKLIRNQSKVSKGFSDRENIRLLGKKTKRDNSKSQSQFHREAKKIKN